MTEYRPDRWVVIKMTHKDETFYKVLGGWSGGYLDGSSWRLNSGVEKCEYDLDNDLYSFYGSSGSVYIVDPGCYGLGSSTASVWEQMKEKYPEQVELLENCDWATMEWTK